MSPGSIPIKNVYYLLCYAWDRLEQGRLIDIEKIPSTDLTDLFATVLVKGVEHLARRGLERGYLAFKDEMSTIRGRIDVLQTTRRFLLEHGRAVCEYDELATNTLPNQIIKSTLFHMVKVPFLASENREALAETLRMLRDIDCIRVTSQNFRRIQFNGNNRFYRFLLNVCELYHGSWLVDEQSGTSRFREFLKDDDKMAALFQAFIFNFLRIERSDLQVQRQNIAWKAEADDTGILSFLPQMQTDVTVRTPTKRIIIEVKYYRETLGEHFGNRKLHSHNMYQLFSYLMNSRQEGELLEGMLLYPRVGMSLSMDYKLHGLPFKIRTLDLAQPWENIHQQLSNLV